LTEAEVGVSIAEDSGTGSSADNYQTIRIEADGPLTWVILNRPEKRNAMNRQMLDELAHAVSGLGAEPGVRAIAIRGAGPSFSSGYDIGGDYARRLADRDSLDEWNDLRSRMDRMMTIWDCPVPVIAAVHGYCLAGATQLCTFCDFVIVTDDSKIGSAGVGGIGAGYVSPMYVMVLGIRRAKELGMIPGRQISGDQAAEWGWANWSVSAVKLLDEVRQLAARCAVLPREIVAANKVAVNRMFEMNGFRYAVQQLADIDVIAHRSLAAAAAGAVLRTEGPGRQSRRVADAIDAAVRAAAPTPAQNVAEQIENTGPSDVHRP
jgi:enoyl-CoA hydratase